MDKIIPGDMVRCVECRSHLTRGKRYLVERIETWQGQKFIVVYNDDGEIGKYYPSRFELHQPAECMNGAEEYEEILACQEAMRDA